MTLTSKSGKLVFSNFKVTIAGGSQNLSKYRIKRRQDGFKLIGKGSGRSSEFLDIVLSYDVETTRQSMVVAALGVSSKKWNKFGGNEIGVEGCSTKAAT
jgi:hypothetical protein